jgi:hypothetical protein
VVAKRKRKNPRPNPNPNPKNQNPKSMVKKKSGGSLTSYDRIDIHQPISQWFFKDYPEADKGHPQADKGHKRTAGSTPLGQVPTEPKLVQLDVDHLNAEIQHTLELGKSLGLLNKHLQVRPLTPNDLTTVIAEFPLAPSNLETFPEPKSLLPMPHLKTMERRKSPKIKEMNAPWYKPDDASSQSCSLIAEAQEERTIVLRFANLLTLFKDRWLDSVSLDAYLHILQEHWPRKEALYVNSAESDPSLYELKHTPGCYRFFLSILFYNSHWTVIMVDNKKKTIRYLNSQVVDQRIPNFQSKPFHKTFPNYTVKNVTKSQQCNQSDCGVYSAAWMMLYLYASEDEFDKLKCKEMYEFRRTILHQLILYYYLMNIDGKGVVNRHRIK